MVVVLTAGLRVHGGDEQQVQPHAEVGEGQVAHEEARDGELVVAGQENEEHGEIAGDGEDVYKPDQHSEEAVSQDVFAGVEGIRFRSAREDFRLTKVILKVKAGHFAVIEDG